MTTKRRLLVGLLVTAGIYTESNARFFVTKSSDAVVDKMTRALSNPMLMASEEPTVGTKTPPIG